MSIKLSDVISMELQLQLLEMEASLDNEQDENSNQRPE